jgi:hypothetical protein
MCCRINDKILIGQWHTDEILLIKLGSLDSGGYIVGKSRQTNITVVQHGIVDCWGGEDMG